MFNNYNPLYIDRTNLVGSWLLNGNALDDSGNGNNGTATNVTYVGADRGYVTDVGSFNGINAYFTANTPSQSSNQNISVSFFTKRTGTGSGANNCVIQFGPTQNSILFGLWINASNQLGIYNSGGGFAYSTDVPTLNEYEHYIFSRDGINVYIYKNLELVYSATNSSNDGASNISTIRMAQRENNSGEFYNGEIGLVRPYNKVLSEDERNNLYQEGLRELGLQGIKTSIDRSNLVLSLEGENNGTTAYDSSGNGNNGTMTNVGIKRPGLVDVFDLDGSSSEIDLPLDTNLQPSSLKTITLTGAIKTSQVPSVYGMIWNGGYQNGTSANSSGFLAVQNNGTLRLTGNGTDVIDSSIAVNDGIPHFIEIVIRSTNAQFYIDGVLRGSGNITLNSSTSSRSPGLGALHDDNLFYYDGLIGLFRTDTGTLSTTEREKRFQEFKEKMFFKKYSTLGLGKNKILDISKPAVSGTYYDQTGNGNNGTATAVTETILGLNNVMSFNSTSSKIVVTDTENIKTIAMTISKDGADTNNMLFTTNSSGTTRYIGQVHTDGNFYCNLGGGTISPKHGIDTYGKFYRIVIVADGTNFKLYNNGVLYSSVSATQSLFYGNIGTGNNGFYTGYFYDGDISNLKTYDRVLSDEEIQEDFYSNFITN